MESSYIDHKPHVSWFRCRCIDIIRYTGFCNFSEKRTSAIANFSIAAAVGEIVGPLIAYLTISVKFTVSDFQFDSFNLVGVWTFMIFCLTFPWAFRSFGQQIHQIISHQVIIATVIIMRKIKLGAIVIIIIVISIMIV